ncbi:MAG: hypothetical protein JNJ78_07925 [Anaerolineae bacterium]|nr:hypothetical protein [Anaerolineae bacterium]
MSIRILTFDPLSQDEVGEAEQELDQLLSSGWAIISSIGGNRSGKKGSKRLQSEREMAESAPVSKDYIVLILHHAPA